MYDSTSRQAYAARLRATRDAFGLTQEEFASRASVARNTYNQYEAGKRLPRRDHELALCEAHGLTLEWLVRGKEQGLPGWLIAKLPPRPTVKVA